MLTMSEIRFTWWWHLTFTFSRITNDYDVLCRKLHCQNRLNLSACTMYMRVNMLKMITQQITSLILFRCRNYLQFFMSWIFCTPANHAYLFLTILSFILECCKYLNQDWWGNKSDLFTIKVNSFVLFFNGLNGLNFELCTLPMKWFLNCMWLHIHSSWSDLKIRWRYPWIR